MLSIWPYMWTPHAVQTCRWMAALVSTTLSRSAFLVTLSLSRDATATSENMAPAGFQHLVHPHT